jgi:hypothetical protein
VGGDEGDDGAADSEGSEGSGGSEGDDSSEGRASADAAGVSLDAAGVSVKGGDVSPEGKGSMLSVRTRGSESGPPTPKSIAFRNTAPITTATTITQPRERRSSM